MLTNSNLLTNSSLKTTAPSKHSNLLTNSYELPLLRSGDLHSSGRDFLSYSHQEEATSSQQSANQQLPENTSGENFDLPKEW
ncbi:hypothetical protein U1Q18_009551, partial [Sarracenia purpurea var. burkii]